MNISIETSMDIKTKQPDFGILVKEGGQFIRIGHLQFLELCKIPSENCIPTKLCTYGMQLDVNEIELVINAFKEANFDTDTIIKQLQQLLVLVSKQYPTKKQTLKSYPFCRVQLLTQKQLDHINELYGLDVKYEAYETFMQTVLSPEILKPLFQAEGVLDVPPIKLGKETQQQQSNDIENLILKLIKKENQ